MRVGFVGAGRIGGPMVERLVAAGHEVRVLARSDQARSKLLAAGASPVASLAEVAAEADVVAICVLTDGQVRQVSLDDGLLAAMKAGSLLITHTTGSPQTVSLLAQRAAVREIEVVDAPISGGPQDIAAGKVTIYAGGSVSAVERARTVLDTYADPIIHAGAQGAGQAVKLLNNALFAANLGLVAATVELAAKLDLSEPLLLDALRRGSASSKALEHVAALGSVAGFAQLAGEFVGKDVKVVQDVVADLGADLGPLEAAHEALHELLGKTTQAAVRP